MELLIGLGSAMIGALGMIIIAWIGGLFKPTSLAEEISALRESNKELRKEVTDLKANEKANAKKLEECYDKMRAIVRKYKNEVRGLRAELYTVTRGTSVELPTVEEEESDDEL